jgi:hypothetical protein
MDGESCDRGKVNDEAEHMCTDVEVALDSYCFTELISKDVEEFGKYTGFLLFWEEFISKIFFFVSIHFVIG